MSNNKSSNILLWLDGGPYSYLNLGIATSLSKFKNFNFYGVVATNQDISFFTAQKFIQFNDLVYYPDCYIKKSSYDLEYLKEVEKKFELNLWLDVYSERFFHKHRTHFHKFSKDEILIIVEGTIKFFTELIERVNPEMIIMQTAGENISNLLLYQLAKKIGIKIIMINAIHIHNKVVLSNNLISREISDEYSKILPNFHNIEPLHDEDFIKHQSLSETIKVQSDFIFDASNYSQKIKHYFQRMNNDPEPIYQNLGKTKSKMIKAKYQFPAMLKKREEFLFSHCIDQIEDENFIYFPLHTEPESKILSTAPFFGNQINVIENVARSIPMGQILYVKEHPGQKSKIWRPIEDYEKILELPNVKLVHPNFNSQKLISNSNAVISITGSTGFEALFYRKPVILFSDEYYDVVSMVKKIQDIKQLPTIIKNHLANFKFNILELNALMEATNSCSISIPYFSMMKDALTVSSTQRNSGTTKSIKLFEKFYSANEKHFELVAKSIDEKI